MTDTDPTAKLRLIFPSTPEAVRQALSELLETLAQRQLQQEELSTVEIVLAEALNNIVEHAYAEKPDGMIDLSVIHRDTGLVVELRDRGIAMPDGEIPLGRTVDPDCARDDLPEGGFGWFLIRDLARDLTYTHENGQNILCFRLVVSPYLAANA